MILNANNFSNKEIFYENIKKMTDLQILTALKNKADYNPVFIELALKEVGIRGYNFNDTDLQNIDLLVIKNKPTSELVKIYVSSSDYKKEWEILVNEELKRRNFDVSTLSLEKENEKKALAEGVEGNIILGYILAVLGGIIGLIMAINYMSRKEKTVSGEKFYKYNDSTRRHGKNMLIVWFIVNTLAMILLLVE